MPILSVDVVSTFVLLTFLYAVDFKMLSTSLESCRVEMFALSKLHIALSCQLSERTQVCTQVICVCTFDLDYNCMYLFKETMVKVHRKNPLNLLERMNFCFKLYIDSKSLFITSLLSCFFVVFL